MVKRLYEGRTSRKEPRIVADSKGNTYVALMNEVEKISDFTSRYNLKRIKDYLDNNKSRGVADETIYDFLFDSVQALDKLFNYVDTYSGTEQDPIDTYLDRL